MTRAYTYITEVIANLAKIDPRVDRLCTHRLALVCGGQSRFSKTQAPLAEFDLDEQDLATLRYRGNGNPGPTAITTKLGIQFEKMYNALWADESTWDIETRCKVCPGALGECADICAADVWPGGAPTGEDPGFNGVVVRSQTGMALMESAVEAGALISGDDILPEQFNRFQPHQVTKKTALAARFAGMADAGVTPLSATDLRVDQLAARLTQEQHDKERHGAAKRFLKVKSNGTDG